MLGGSTKTSIGEMLSAPVDLAKRIYIVTDSLLFEPMWLCNGELSDSRSSGVNRNDGDSTQRMMLRAPFQIRVRRQAAPRSVYGSINT